MDGERICVGVAKLWVFGALLVALFLTAGAQQASADVGTEINALPTLDALNRSENPLANSGSWTKLNWASTAGSDAAAGWIPASGFPTVNGAYWTPSTFSDGTGEAAALTMASAPGISERYISVWLDMASPGTAKSGYQLRWTVEPSGGTYTLKLSKWAAGEETVLATKAGVTIAAGSTLALADSGSSLSVWQGTGGTLSQVLTAADSTYASGYAGIEGSGSNSRSTNFKAGTLAPPPPPDTTISAGPKGEVVPNVSFAFSGTNSPTGFECSLDGGAFAACSSPKSLTGLAEGSHTFSVRGVNGGGADATPAEQSFRVLTAVKTVSKVPILDSFERSEVPLASSKFSKPSWAAAIGGTWMGTYRGYGSSGGLAGAYWNQGSFGDGGEATVLASGVVGTGATPAGQYLALWLDMPDPANARSGYEARFTGGGSATSYTAELAKWVAGTRTVLASTSGVSLAVGTTMALTETAGGSLALWTGTSSLTPLLSASATDYSAGYAGLEVNGGAGTIYNFRAGRVDLTPPETTITSGPTGPVLPAAASFAFSASEAGSSFECALDTAFSLCTSPKSYSTAAAGPHTFKVRALDAVGNQDETPAERSFTIVAPPTVATAAAGGVTATQANLKGTANPNGDATTYQFEYGTTTTYGSKVPASPKAIGSGTAAVEVSEAISGLTMGTTYHYRLVATNGAGTSKGEDKTFTTVAAPLATTEAATELSATEAKLNATVNPRGGATTYQFEYGPTTSYGSKVPATAKSAGAGTTAVAASAPVTGLAEGSTYHYRVVAENVAGKTYGLDQGLTTLVVPEATTEAATAIEGEEATLNGEVDPNGSDTTYYFQYGETTSYGSQAPLEGETAGSGSAGMEVSAYPTLEPETTYHYRVVAMSSAGTDFGQDMTATTSAASAGGDNNGEFVNLGWSGNWQKEGDPAHLKIVQKSGAKLLRVGLFQGHQGEGWKAFNDIFCNAAKVGITIQPYLYPGAIPTGGQALTDWKTFVREAVQRYGPGGTLWATCGASKPVKYWEVYNEENWGPNTGFGVNPKAFGEFYEATAGVINSTAGAGNVEVIVGGLLSVGSNDSQKMKPGDFLKAMNQSMAHPNLINAVGVHPYAFSVNGHEPRTHNQVVDLVEEKIKANIKEVHEVLPGKPLWVNEIGFPTQGVKNEATGKWEYESDGSHLPVTLAIQKELVRESIEMMEKRSGDLRIHNVFYYNDWDNGNPGWDYHSGLQSNNENFRPAWYAFTTEAHGDGGYPRKSRNKTKGHKDKARASTLYGTVDPEDLTTYYFFQYGKTTAYGSSTAVASAGFEAGEREFSQVATGLVPETTYHYRIVSYNVNGEYTYGEDATLTTPPSSSTSINLVRVLHGQPGYAWFEGWVKEGDIQGSLPGLGNVHVHINLYRNGASQPERFVDVMTNGEGHYVSGYFPVGKSSWVAKAEFPGGGEWLKSESGPEPFVVRDGVRIRAQHSGGCWDIFGAQQQNGAAVMHGACNEPPSSNQVFELVPQEGGQYLNIVARNSGRCVDVVNGSTADGSGLQQYDCLGAGQSNQLFREAWSGNWLSYVAKHSNKCVDVTGANQGWINLQQWTCNASPQQAFRLEPVESGPKPTETFISTSHILHGNGQYGNWGLISVSGHVLAGAYSMQNRVAQVEFEKLVNGNYVRTDNLGLTVNAAGEYRFNDYGLAPGIWRVRTEFVGNGEYQGSTSAWHDFSIFQANRLIARHSGKCLSLSENRNVNGQHLIQWDCAGTGSLQDGQTFWFWPLGNHIYEITVVSSGKCLDIANGSTANGAVLQQWDCNGYGQQLWELLPIAGQDGYYALRPQHSLKCLDVAGASTGNGAEVWQWDCHWGGNQQWIVSGVVGG